MQQATSHAALHIDSFKLNKKGDRARDEVTKVYSACVDIPQSSCDSPGIEETMVLHAIVSVKLKQKGSNRTVSTYTFYDGGSGGCFATESIKNKLGAEGIRTRL